MKQSIVASSRSSRSSAYSDDDDDDYDFETPTAKCVRKVAQFSKLQPFDVMDKPTFTPEYLDLRIPMAAPKIARLFEKIAELDKADMARHGQLFKHMVFTDLKSSNIGIKLLASAFVAKGFVPAFEVHGKGFHCKKEEELTSPARHFGMLISKTFFDRSMSVPFKKAQLDAFNRRPDNEHGKLIRFMLLDQGFKEGIDLFDVKYVHLMEPLVYPADEKQAIGRGTRFCGQKGLEFHPRFGWPLYVFRYDVSVPSGTGILTNADTLMGTYLENAIIDVRKLVFAAELERATIEAAVDRELTAYIHGFTVPTPPPAGQFGGAGAAALPPPERMSLRRLTNYIRANFSQFEYPTVKLEKQCGGAAAQAATIVQFTPTQDFVRHYFTPQSPYKGILYWHSVGTGKSCSGIATASHTFEPQGYNIMWVTRHTLKSDIFKNMYKQVCSLVIQQKMKDGTMKMPRNMAIKHAGPQWIEPLSYKQFSNMLLKKNKFYQEIKRRNGAEDPLRKTLLIIDEAHKLYAANVAAAEKADASILEKMIQNSYKVSGADSVRVVLMTATPFTEDGMELIRLLNLLRPAKDALPATFEGFSSRYLRDDGTFTKAGKAAYADDVAGYVSYLNRSQDARSFAYPVIEDVRVPMTRELEDPSAVPEDGLANQLLLWEGKVREIKDKRRADIRVISEAKKDANREAGAQAKADGAKLVAKCIANADAALESAKAKIEAAKAACGQLKPAAEKKKCKAKATEQGKEQLAVLKERKKECTSTRQAAKAIREPLLEDIKADYENKVAEIEKGVNESLKDYIELKARYDALKQQRARNNGELREMKPDYLHLKARMNEIKLKWVAAKKAAKKIKDKAERLATQRKVREGVGAEFKEIYGKVNDVRSEITRLRISNRLLRIQQGTATVGDISQEKALKSKCNL